MRCPKCGYNSFDHLESCKKCGKDLVEFKERYNIRSVLFPGEMKPTTVAAFDDAEAGGNAAEAAVAAAAVATTAAAAVDDIAQADDFAEATETSSGQNDDFGFDFMGESAEEEDLSFDELFEDAPADEDVEETLPSPEEEAAAAEADLAAPDDFAFDDVDAASEAETADKLSAEDELEDDFGFSVDDATEETAEAVENIVEDAEDLSTDDFELPPADKEAFSFSNDEVEFEESDAEDADQGTKEDPKDPFELPGSPQDEESPEQASDLSVTTPAQLTALNEDVDLPIEETVNRAGQFAQSGQVEEADLLPREEEMPLDPPMADPFVTKTVAEVAEPQNDKAAVPLPAADQVAETAAFVEDLVESEPLPQVDEVASAELVPPVVAADESSYQPSEPLAQPGPADDSQVDLSTGDVVADNASPATAAPAAAPEEVFAVAEPAAEAAVHESVGLAGEAEKVIADEAGGVDEVVPAVASAFIAEAEPDEVVAELAEVAAEAIGPKQTNLRDETESVAASGAALTAGAVATAAVAVASKEDGTGAVEVRIVSEPQKENELRPSLAGRIGAFCCDLLLLTTVGFCFVVAAEMAMADAGDGLFPSLDTLIDLSVPYFLVLFFLAFGYFTLFHFLAGQTPGEMLARLRVETVEGEPLTFSQAFLRSVGGLLQLLPAGLGCLVILFSKEQRGWNDQLAGTRLIALHEQLEEG